MYTKTVYDSLKTHFANSIVKHFAYDEKQSDNESQEVQYATPALFINFSDDKEDGLMQLVAFKLRLEIKTIGLVDTTLGTATSVYRLIESYTGNNGQKIRIKNFKASHKAGNAPVHTFDCQIYLRK